MMLTASSYYPQNIYMPLRPSPLSERSANVVPRAFHFDMTSQTPAENKAQIPQRAFKPNPVVQTRDAATKRRRDMFFRRVQKDRDDKKWNARGEQIQRLDYLTEHKRWEAEKTREAHQLDDDMIEEGLLEEAMSSHMSSSATRPEQQIEEVDYILDQEEHELQELIAMMEQEQDNASQHYGSDDEDYDQIFMECTSAAEPQQLQHQILPNTDANASFDDVDVMDMS